MNGIELKCFRKNNEKHFLQKDGSIMAVVYNSNVHYKDIDNNIYEEIDNNIVDSVDCFKNRKNSFKVNFNKNTLDKNIQIEYENKKLDITILTTNSNNNRIIKHNNHIIYDEFLSNIKFDYYISGTKLKENIILKNKSSLNEKIEFYINTELNLFLQRDGSIIAYDNDKKIYLIEKPYMYDTNGIRCDNVFYKLEKVDNGYLLKLEFDKLWLQLPETKYPVIIDPTISEISNAVTQDTVISSNSLTIPNDSSTLVVGKYSDDDEIHRTLLKFSLPELDKSSLVISARIELTGYVNSSENDINEYTIDVHQITENWDENTAIWQDMHDKYNEHIEDNFLAVRSSSLSEKVTTSFDITNLVKKWYNGLNNYGVMLMAHEETDFINGDVAKFYSKDNIVSDGSNPSPVLYINYYNMNGLDELMTYQTNKCSYINAKVNTFNGALNVEANITNLKSDTIPFDLKLYYNTYDIVNNKNYGLSSGWKFNYNQTINHYNELDEVLEYIDADGTALYFYKNLTNDGTYIYYNSLKDLTIDIRDDDLILKDNNYYYLFTKCNQNWLLAKIYSANQDNVFIYYDESQRVSRIVTDTSEEIKITYEDTKIIIEANDDKAYLYLESSKIKSLSINDEIVNVRYNEHNLIERISFMKGNSIGYTYDDVLYYRVSKITEFGINDVIGNYVNMEYGINATTIVDNLNRINTYNFNEYGVVESITNVPQQADLTNSLAIAKNIDNNETPFPNCSNMLIRYIDNYIKNYSFEEQDDVFAGANQLITTEESYSGSRCLKLDFSSSSTALSDSITLPIGKTYTFSLYAKSNDNNAILKLYLEYYQNIEQIVNIEKLIPLTSEWKKYEISINIENDIDSAVVEKDLNIAIDSPSSSIIYCDDFQLEEGAISNPLNIIENSNFNSRLYSWILNVRGEDRYLSTIPDFEFVTFNNGRKAIKINSDLKKRIELTKRIKFSGLKGDVYDFSFWYKNYGIDSSLTKTRNTSVIVNFINTESNATEVLSDDDVNSNLGALNCFNLEWQFFCKSIEAPNDYNYIDIYVVSENDSNSLYLTNFSLYRTEEIEITNSDNFVNNTIYATNKTKSDLENRIISSTLVNQYDEKNSYYIREFETNKYLNGDFINRTISLKDDLFVIQPWKIMNINEFYSISSLLNEKYYLNVKNNELVLGLMSFPIFEFIYDNKECFRIKIKELEMYLNIVNDSFVFDDNGTLFYLESASDEKFINTYTIYNDDNKIDYDELGNKTISLVSNIDEKISTTINSKGVEEIIKYDETGKLIERTKKDKKISYNYNFDDLSTVICGKNVYTFLYDAFNNLKGIKLNDNLLFEYVYKGFNGMLEKVIYPNNDEISMEYDTFDRIIQRKDANNTYNYIYDNLGRVKKIIIVSNKIENTSNYDIIYYDYNSENLLISLQHNRIVNGIEHWIYSICNKYCDNQLVETNYMLYGHTNLNINKTLTENGYVKQIQFDSNDKIDFDYDQLGRIAKKSINNIINTDYTYKTNGHRTSNLIGEIRNNYDNLSYEYDSLNNIKHIKVNGLLKYMYMYDDYNQLIEEKNCMDKIKTTYKYDILGNLILKKIYSITSNNLIEMIKMEYDDNNKLIKFNNNSIQYDEVGNIVKSGNNEYTWTNGNELCRAIVDGNDIYFNYSENGARISKTGVDYYLDGNKIIFENRNGQIIEYFYDHNDDIIGFKYLEAKYYFTKNAQNDIMKIVDSQNLVVAEYEYDPWGVVKVFNYNALNIGTVNPFRYKGYYYDNETQLYYLNNRYYDPKLCRFISQDRRISLEDDIFSNNLYIYCNNNPIMEVDPIGYKSYFRKEKIYRAKLAVEYARKHNGENLKKAPYNPQYSVQEMDCANFVSQCLHAGGIEMDEQWYSIPTVITIIGGGKKFKKIKHKVSTTWIRVLEQRSWLRKKKYIASSFSITKSSKIKEAIRKGVKPGDVVYMITSIRQGGKYTHAVIVVKVTKNIIYYAGHTNNRACQDLETYFEDGVSLGWLLGIKPKVEFNLMKGIDRLVC